MHLRAVAFSTLSLFLTAFSAQAEVKDGRSLLCPTVHADYVRRQLEEWNASSPFIDEGDKHIPHITFQKSNETETSTNAVVTVGGTGGIYHPMVASDKPEDVHIISHIYVMDQDNKIVAMKLTHPETEDVPIRFFFQVPEGATELTPYAFCNLHGLWKGPTVNQPYTEGLGEPQDNCGPSNHDVRSKSFMADYFLQQRNTFDSDVAYTEEKDEKHTPYITITEANGKIMGSVVVGTTEVFHPMNGVDYDIVDSTPHWINTIWVVDQEKELVAMEHLDVKSEANGIAQIKFEVPDSVTTLKAYSFCNIHGMWEGPSVDIQSDKNTVDVHSDENGANTVILMPWRFIILILSMFVFI